MSMYFAYGSCMNLIDLLRDVPEAKFIGPATLHDYCLGFTIWADKRGGGVADIVPETGEKVEGIIFDVPNFVGLDRREGHPHLYKRINVQVTPFSGRYPIEVTTYGVVHKEANEVEPSKDYITIILDGAKNLSATYRENLMKRFKHIIDE